MRLMDLSVAHVILSLANQKWNIMCLNLYFIVFNLAAIFGSDQINAILSDSTFYCINVNPDLCLMKHFTVNT